MFQLGPFKKNPQLRDIYIRLDPRAFGPSRAPEGRPLRATFPVQREGEKRSPRVDLKPNVPKRHQLVTVRMLREQDFAKKNLSKARFSTFQVLQSKDTYR